MDACRVFCAELLLYLLHGLQYLSLCNFDGPKYWSSSEWSIFMEKNIGGLENSDGVLKAKSCWGFGVPADVPGWLHDWTKIVLKILPVNCGIHWEHVAEIYHSTEHAYPK